MQRITKARHATLWKQTFSIFKDLEFSSKRHKRIQKITNRIDVIKMRRFFINNVKYGVQFFSNLQEDNNASNVVFFSAWCENYTNGIDLPCNSYHKFQMVFMT